MPDQLDVFNKLAEAEATPDFSIPFTGNLELDQAVIEHKVFLNPATSFLQFGQYQE